MVPKYRLKLYTNVDALKVGAWVKTDVHIQKNQYIHAWISLDWGQPKPKNDKNVTKQLGNNNLSSVLIIIVLRDARSSNEK